MAVLPGQAMAEVRDEHLVIGAQQVWIEVIEPVEVMWVGPNQNERMQVLSGPDIEIVAKATGPQDAGLIGAKALVAVVPASHSCDDLSDPLAYYVITLGQNLATDGPLTSCGVLEVSFAPGGIMLEADPMGEGAFWAWMPGVGFRDLLE